MSFDFKLIGGDLQVKPAGTIAIQVDDSKLRQDLLKILLTPIGSNKAYPWYGSPLGTAVIGRLLDPRILKSEILNSITFAINNLIRLQKEQERSGQFLTPAEAISKILDVSVEQSIQDGRQYNIGISVLTRRGNVINETFALTP